MEYYEAEIEGASVKYKGSVWFSGTALSGLYRADEKTGIAEYIKPFLREKNCHNVHRRAYLYEGKAWFTPWEGVHIACVDLETYDIRYYDIPGEKVRDALLEECGAAYSGSVRYDKDHFILIPAAAEAPVIVDMKSGVMKVLEGVVKENESFEAGCCHDGFVWMIPKRGREWSRLDPVTGRADRLPWNEEPGSFGGPCSAGGRIFFTPVNADHILIYDPSKDEYERIPLGDFYRKGWRYDSLQPDEGRLWILPRASQKILYLELKDLTVHEIERQQYPAGRVSLLRAFETDDGSLYAAAGMGSYFAKLDKESGRWESVTVRIPACEWQRMLKEKHECGNLEFDLPEYTFPERKCGLDFFLDKVAAGSKAQFKND